MDETDDSPLRLVERDVNIIPRAQESPKREETPRHVRKARAVKNLHERMAADSRLSYRMKNSGNTGSPVLNNEDEDEKVASIDCTPDVELPGLDTDEEDHQAEVEQLDWKNPKNKNKFEKHNKRRRSRLFDSPAMSPVVKRQRNAKVDIMVTSTPLRTILAPPVDSFDDSFEAAATTAITAKDDAENATDDFTDDSFFEQLATQQQAQVPLQKIEQKKQPEVAKNKASAPPPPQDGNGTDDFDDDTFMEEHAQQIAASQIPKPNFAPKEKEKPVVQNEKPTVVIIYFNVRLTESSRNSSQQCQLMMIGTRGATINTFLQHCSTTR